MGKAVDGAGPQAGLRKLVDLTSGWPEHSTISWRRAAWMAVLGDDQATLEALQEAVRTRNINLMFVAVDPLYDHLHLEPRFQALVESMGLRHAPEFRPTLGQNRAEPSPQGR